MKGGLNNPPNDLTMKLGCDILIRFNEGGVE